VIQRPPVSSVWCAPWPCAQSDAASWVARAVTSGGGGLSSHQPGPGKGGSVGGTTVGKDGAGVGVGAGLGLPAPPKRML
jgi:hypothetical protein